MAKTAAISMRIDPQLKTDAETVFGRFGLSITDAINVFLHKSVMEGGIPFDVRQPRYNAATEAAMEEARAIMAGTVDAKRYASAAEAFAELEQ